MMVEGYEIRKIYCKGEDGKPIAKYATVPTCIGEHSMVPVYDGYDEAMDAISERLEKDEPLGWKELY